MCARNVARQALDFHFAQHLLQNAALLLHAGGFALQHDGHADRQLLVHGDALQVDVQQRALDGLVLPVHDHGLGAFAASTARSKIVLWPVSECRMRVTWRGSTRDRQRVLAGAVEHAGNLAAHAHPAGDILVARGVAVALLKRCLSVAVAIILIPIYRTIC